MHMKVAQTDPDITGMTLETKAVLHESGHPDPRGLLVVNLLDGEGNHIQHNGQTQWFSNDVGTSSHNAWAPYTLAYEVPAGIQEEELELKVYGWKPSDPGQSPVWFDDLTVDITYATPTIKSYMADIKNTYDYYPFGMIMPGRNFNEGEYRFGFNGKERDDSWFGTGTIYDYGFRIYDARIGKFLSVDPLTKSYPMLTPYQFASNTPLMGVDKDGLELEITITAKYWQNRVKSVLEQGDDEMVKIAALAPAMISLTKTLDDLPNDAAKKWAQGGGGWVNGKPSSTRIDESFEGIRVIYGKDNQGNVLSFTVNPTMKTAETLQNNKEGYGLVGAGMSVDATYANRMFGGTIEGGTISSYTEALDWNQYTGDLTSNNVDNSMFFSYGLAMGKEKSVGFNMIMVMGNQDFKSKDYEGTSFTYNKNFGKYFSVAIGTSDDFNYQYIKIGVGDGSGFSISGTDTKTFQSPKEYSGPKKGYYGDTKEGFMGAP